MHEDSFAYSEDYYVDYMEEDVSKEIDDYTATASIFIKLFSANQKLCHFVMSVKKNPHNKK
jgi:hypothetical protein